MSERMNLTLVVPSSREDDLQGRQAVEELLARASDILHASNAGETCKFINEAYTRMDLDEIDALQARLMSQRHQLFQHFADIWRKAEQTMTNSSDDGLKLSGVEAMERVLDGLKIADFGRKEIANVTELIGLTFSDTSCISMFLQITLWELHSLFSLLMEVMDSMWRLYEVELDSPWCMAGVSSIGSDASFQSFSSTFSSFSPTQAEIDDNCKDIDMSHRFAMWGATGDESDDEDDQLIDAVF